MSQTRRLYDLFKLGGWKLEAVRMWDNWARIGRKYNNRISDLRALGFSIEYDPASPETNRLYVLHNPDHFPEQWKEKISEPKPTPSLAPADVQTDIPSAPLFKDRQAVFWFR